MPSGCGRQARADHALYKKVRELYRAYAHCNGEQSIRLI